MSIVISPVGTADVEPIVALAHLIWQNTYRGIISQEQIDFMLAQRYDVARLRAELATPDLWWDQIRVDGELVGFASYFALPNGEMKLDKIYVHPQRQRSGLGQRLIEWVAMRARRRGFQTLILAVNKRNRRAVAAYHKHGFAIRDAVCVDIGGGFVMDDFIMAKPLSADPEVSEVR